MKEFIDFIIKLLRKIFGSDEINKNSELLSYCQKERTMNSSEQALYINLQQILSDRFIVLSKVRLEDFIDVDTRGLSRNEWWGQRGKIKSRHVDFLICDRNTTRPILAIELDGSSHQNANRIERDNFIDKLYTSIHLRVEHIRVGSDFVQEVEKIKTLLLQ
jgi:hypothetical protein